MEIEKIQQIYEKWIKQIEINDFDPELLRLYTLLIQAILEKYILGETGLIQTIANATTPEDKPTLTPNCLYGANVPADDLYKLGYFMQWFQTMNGPQAIVIDTESGIPCIVADYQIKFLSI
jgi:hypothetical protein